MNTEILSALAKIACVVTVLTAVACTGSTTREPGAKTGTAASAASGPADVEEEGAADKILCAVDADCDSDERCEAGRCAGLDGDKD